jgi:hypothetical protein
LAAEPSPAPLKSSITPEDTSFCEKLFGLCVLCDKNFGCWLFPEGKEKITQGGSNNGLSRVGEKKI